MADRRGLLLPLTGIRFFLALWVIVFHQTTPRGWLAPCLSRLPSLVFCLLRTGYLAVGVFFILSGFVLSYSYSLEERWSRPQYLRYAAARVGRIYPTYCLGLVLMVPIVAIPVVTHFSWLRLSKEIVIATLNWALLQSWIPKIALSWNLPGWSLSNEAFFYLCFPFAGIALWRAARPKRVLLVLSLLWLVGLIAPVLAIVFPASDFGRVAATAADHPVDHVWANFLTFNPILRLSDFCIGIAIGRLYHDLRQRRSPLLGRGFWLYLPALLLEILVISRAKILPFALVSNGLLTPIHAMIILGLALGGGAPARLLALRPLVFWGNASYAMYILHYPIALYIGLVSRRVWGHSPAGVGATSLYVAVVVILAGAVFVFIEEPIHRALKSKQISGA